MYYTFAQRYINRPGPLQTRQLRNSGMLPKKPAETFDILKVPEDVKRQSGSRNRDTSLNEFTVEYLVFRDFEISILSIRIQPR